MTAYEEGQQAYRAEGGVGDNPYALSTLDADQWYKGWMHEYDNDYCLYD